MVWIETESASDKMPSTGNAWIASAWPARSRSSDTGESTSRERSVISYFIPLCFPFSHVSPGLCVLC